MWSRVDAVVPRCVIMVVKKNGEVILITRLERYVSSSRLTNLVTDVALR